MVVGSFVRGELRIAVSRSQHLIDVPLTDVPLASRLPNSRVWVTFTSSFERVSKIETRLPHDNGPETASSIYEPKRRA